MKHTPRDARSSLRRSILIICLTASVLWALNSFLLLPIYTRMDSDILYRDTWGCLILSWLTRAVDPLVFLIVYPTALYALWKNGFRRSKAIPLVFTLLTVLKFLVNFLVDCVTSGSFPSFSVWVHEYLPIALPALLLEVLQFYFVLLIAFLAFRRHERLSGWKMIGSGQADDPREGVFPFGKLFCWRNPLQFSALWISVYMFLGQAVSLVIYAVTQWQYSGSTDGIPYFLYDLLCALLMAFIQYFVSLLLLSRYDRLDVAGPKA